MPITQLFTCDKCGQQWPYKTPADFVPAKKEIKSGTPVEITLIAKPYAAYTNECRVTQIWCNDCAVKCGLRIPFKHEAEALGVPEKPEPAQTLVTALRELGMAHLDDISGGVQ